MLLTTPFSLKNGTNRRFQTELTLFCPPTYPFFMIRLVRDMRIPLLEMDSVSAKLNMMPATVTSSALALFWLPLPLVPGPSSFRLFS